MTAIRTTVLAILAGYLAIAISSAEAAPRKSSDVVKLDVKAGKPDADGNQVLTITLTMEAGWHTYANPVGNKELIAAQTKVAVAGKAKPEAVKVEYPEGKVVKDATIGDYKVYEGQTTITAKIKRAKGDSGPLEVSVRLQACTDKMCLLPDTLKATVP